MGRLDLDRLLKQYDCSLEDFSEAVGISKDQLLAYKEGRLKISQEEVQAITKESGLQYYEFWIEDDVPKRRTALVIEPEDTFCAARKTQTGLVEYLKKGLEETEEPVVLREIEEVEHCVKMLRKPRIALAGQSDTGKSTLINALLGAEKMPAKWTPTTAIVVHIKHIDERPPFMKDDVWIFGRQSAEEWDEKRLNDEDYCNKFVLAKGDFSLLSTFGTHQGRQKEQAMASAAVAFIDSPLLKDCDILDLPGFAANAEDDALHEFNTKKNVTDILIYLSRANGFLQDRNIDYLKECIKSLRPVEKKDENNIEKLENLFVVASQAMSVDKGNVTEIKKKLNERCDALCDILGNGDKEADLLHFRSRQTGYTYKREDIRGRFFYYDTDLPRLQKQFCQAVKQLVEKFPQAIQQEFTKQLKVVVSGATSIVKARVEEWEQAISHQQEFLDLYNEIQAKEPDRKAELNDRLKEMSVTANNLCIESCQEIQDLYNKQINVEAIVDLIEKKDLKNKSTEKQDFASALNETLSTGITKILEEKSKKYSAQVDKFLKEYSGKIKSYGTNQRVKVQFDTTNAFAMGLIGLGTVGASAAWLATSFTAWSVFAGGIFAGLGPILAVTGVLGLSVSALIATLLSIFKIFTWKNDLAKAIVKAYEKEGYIDKVQENVKDYWKETEIGFADAVQQVEIEWEKKIEEYRMIADEENMDVLKAKIQRGKRGIDFFEQMPIPGNG